MQFSIFSRVVSCFENSQDKHLNYSCLVCMHIYTTIYESYIVYIYSTYEVLKSTEKDSKVNSKWYTLQLIIDSGLNNRGKVSRRCLAIWSKKIVLT